MTLDCAEESVEQFAAGTSIATFLWKTVTEEPQQVELQKPDSPSEALGEASHRLLHQLSRSALAQAARRRGRIVLA